MKTLTYFAAAALLCLGVQSLSHANHVDFMVDGGFTLVTDNLSGPASATQTGDAGNVLGEEREVGLSFASGTGVLSTALLVPSGPGPVGPDTTKQLLLSNSVNGLGTLELTYDGVGSAGLGGLDFDTAWDSVAVGVPAIQGDGNLSVTVSDGTNSGTYTRAISSPLNYFFPFTNAAYAGVDFTAVDSVVVTFETTTAATDVAFSQITREVGTDDTAIPEPTSLALFAAGLIGLGLASRKK